MHTDVRAAAAWLQLASDKDDSDAQWMLGRMYYDGLIQSPNQEEEKRKRREEEEEEEEKREKKPRQTRWMKAASLFEESASVNNVKGILYLGLVNEVGAGVKKNSKLAVMYYEQAVEMGEDEAKFNLAMMLLDGRGVQRDVGRAATLLRECGKRGKKGKRKRREKREI